MAKSLSTTDKIIAAAEKRMQDSGYHGVSFRDVAADVGIKSASVHHHFPTKADLAAAVIRSYAQQHRDALGDPADEKRRPSALIATYIDLFRRDLAHRGRMCLCGVLASEVATLPREVQAELRGFFDHDVAWLETVLSRKYPRARRASIKAKALMAVSAMEGGVLIAHCHADAGRFDRIAKVLSDVLEGSTPP